MNASGPPFKSAFWHFQVVSAKPSEKRGKFSNAKGLATANQLSQRLSEKADNQFP